MYTKFCLYGFLKNQKFFDPFFILFFLESGFSFFQIGILISIREIATNILEIPSGFIADMYGRRRSMIFAFTGYIISFLVFFFWPSFVAACGAMILFAVGEAFRTGTHKAMILTYLERNGILDKKVEYYGKTRSWSQIGSTVSSLISAAIVFISGSIRLVFLFSAIPYVAGLVLMLTYPKYLDGRDNENKPVAKDFFRDIVQLIRHPLMAKPVFYFSLYQGAFKSLKDYIQPIIVMIALSLPFLTNFDVDSRTSVATGAVYFVLFFITSAASRHSHKFQLLDRKQVMLLILFLIQGVLFLFLGVMFEIKVLLIVLFVFVYILNNIVRPMQVGLISELMPSKVFASGLSVESQITSLFAAVIAPLFGLAVDGLGLSIAFLIFGGGLLVVYLFGLIWELTRNA